jgi:hypothetical protein
MKLALSRFPSLAVVVPVLLTASLTVIGCSKGSGGSAGTGTQVAGPKGGSCAETKEGLCTEFGENPGGIAEGACTSLMKGTYTKASCSHDATIGSCASKGDVIYYYFGNASGPWTEDAAEDCKSIHEGTFTATAGAADTAKQKALPTADRIGGNCAHEDGSCDDYFGDEMKLGLDKTFCDGAGKWTDGQACPTDNLAASCLSAGEVHRYYAPAMKKAHLGVNDVASLCKSGTLGFSHFYPVPGATPPPAAVAAASKAKKK